MKAQLTTITPEGTITTEVVAQPLNLMDLLHRLQKAVGGNFEVMGYFTTFEVDGALVPCCAFCNEDIPDHEVVVNETATRLWNEAWARSDTTEQFWDKAKGTIAVITGPKELLAQL